MGFSSFVNGEVFYLKIDDAYIEFGEYDESNRKTKIQKYNIEDAEKLITEFQKNRDLNVLYYIHSLYGHFRPYHKNSINQLKKIKGIDKIICIEWNAKKIWYKKVWKYAGVQGEQIGNLMDSFFSINKNSILCHSMGNRVFEGIATKLTPLANVEKIILAAADLDINSFQNGSLFNNFKVDEIVVLVNERDHMLRLSKSMHRKKRLGLNGCEENLFSEIDNKEKVDIWNVTREVKDGKSGSWHIYFKRTESVFTRIKTKLEN
jgi:hypothetical protein